MRKIRWREAAYPPNRPEIRFRRWLEIPADDLAAASPLPFTLVETREELHERFADDLLAEIAEPRRRGERVSLIVPLGPTGQYPILARRLNEARLSLDEFARTTHDVPRTRGVSAAFCAIRRFGCSPSPIS